MVTGTVIHEAGNCVCSRISFAYIWLPFLPSSASHRHVWSSLLSLPDASLFPPQTIDFASSGPFGFVHNTPVTQRRGSHTIRSFYQPFHRRKWMDIFPWMAEIWIRASNNWSRHPYSISPGHILKLKYEEPSTKQQRNLTSSAENPYYSLDTSVVAESIHVSFGGSGPPWAASALCQQPRAFLGVSIRLWSPKIALKPASMGSLDRNWIVIIISSYVLELRIRSDRDHIKALCR